MHFRRPTAVRRVSRPERDVRPHMAHNVGPGHDACRRGGRGGLYVVPLTSPTRTSYASRSPRTSCLPEAEEACGCLVRTFLCGASETPTTRRTQTRQDGHGRPRRQARRIERASLIPPDFGQDRLEGVVAPPCGQNGQLGGIYLWHGGSSAFGVDNHRFRGASRSGVRGRQHKRCARARAHCPREHTRPVCGLTHGRLTLDWNVTTGGRSGYVSSQ